MQVNRKTRSPENTGNVISLSVQNPSTSEEKQACYDVVSENIDYQRKQEEREQSLPLVGQLFAALISLHRHFLP